VIRPRGTCYRRCRSPTAPSDASQRYGLDFLERSAASSPALSVQRYCRSAAGARGSEATDAPVRLQRLVGRLPLGAEFEQACASIFADTGVTMPQKPPDGVDVPGIRYDRQHLYRSTDVVHLRVDKQLEGGASYEVRERGVRCCTLGYNLAQQVEFPKLSRRSRRTPPFEG
jgi:hypothetical protein